MSHRGSMKTFLPFTNRIIQNYTHSSVKYKTRIIFVETEEIWSFEFDVCPREPINVGLLIKVKIILMTETKTF